MAISAGNRNLTGRQVILLFLIALTLRLLYISEIAALPGFSCLEDDPLMYYNQAVRYAESGVLFRGVFFKAPLYPFLLGLFFKFFGPGFLAPRIIQAVMGSVSAVLIGCIGAFLFGRRAGLLAGLMAAVYGMFIYFDGELLITSLILLLDLAGMLLLLSWWEKLPALRTRRDAVLPIASGLIFGLSALARPTVLPAVPILALLLLAGTGGAASRHRLQALLLPVAAVIVILPVTARNYAVGGEFNLISTQGGLAFYTGNNPDSDGMFGVPAGFPQTGGNFEYYDCASYAESVTGHKLLPGQVSSFLFGEGLRFWIEQPVDAARLFTKKTILFFGNHEISSNRNIPDWLGRSMLQRFLPLSFAMVLALAVSGFIAAAREGGLRPGYPVVLFAGVYSLTVIMFFVAARYRVPVIAMMMPFAGKGVTALAENTSRRDWRTSIPLWGAAILVFTLSSADPFGLRGNDRGGQVEFGDAVTWLRSGETERAIVGFRRTLELNPRYPRAHLNLGVIAFEKASAAAEPAVRDSLFDAAAAEYQAELENNPGDEMALNNLGVIFLEKKNPVRAEVYFRKALETRGNYIRAFRNLALSLVRQGRRGDAVRVLEDGIEIASNPIEYEQDEAGLRRDLGALLRDAGRVDEALRQFETARDLRPARAENYVDIGMLLAQQNDAAGAETALLRAVELDPGLGDAWVNLGNLQSRAGRINQALKSYNRAVALDSPEGYYNLALLQNALGRHDEATRTLEECLSRHPGFAPAAAAQSLRQKKK